MFDTGSSLRYICNEGKGKDKVEGNKKKIEVKSLDQYQNWIVIAWLVETSAQAVASYLAEISPGCNFLSRQSLRQINSRHSVTH